MDLLEPSVLFQQLSRNHHLKQRIVRVERLQVHAQLAEVNRDLFHTLLDQACLVHIHSRICLSCLLRRLLLFLFNVLLLFFLLAIELLLNKTLDEVRVLQHVADPLEISLTRVDSECHRKLLIQSLQEGLELIICRNDIGENFLQSKQIYDKRVLKFRKDVIYLIVFIKTI